MSDNPRGTNPFDPTDERTADQSTQTASGLSSGRRARPGAEEPKDTPRRDEQPAAEDDPAGPPTRD